MTSNLKKRWQSYLQPIEPVKYAGWAFGVVFIEAFRLQGLRAWLDTRLWLDKAFVLWYQTLNEHFNRFEGQSSVPGLVKQARGTVLELGPALGNQLVQFDTTKVDRIYGVEPNSFFFPDLKARIADSHLQDKYTIVPCGIQDTDILEDNGIVAEHVDTIVSIQVLCSVPNPEAVARGLYKLLKPGGKLIFWEHHHSHDRLTSIIQSKSNGAWNPAWRFAVGGCNLNRNMLHILKQAGDWVNFSTIEGDEEEWSILPHIWGELIKSS